MDARRAPTDHDRGMMEYLAGLGVPALVVATKMDKLKQSERKEHVERIIELLGLEAEQLVPFSSHTGEGRDELLAALDVLLGVTEG